VDNPSRVAQPVRAACLEQLYVILDLWSDSDHKSKIIAKRGQLGRRQRREAVR